MQIATDQYQQNLDGITAQFFDMLKPPAPLTVTEWAEANRILSEENCALPGPYRVSITPFMREVLDCITDPKVEKILMMKSAQVAWTDGIVNNVVGYFIDHDPAPILTLFPTESMAQRYSKEKLAPMIRDTKPLRGKVKDPKSRDSGNTILSKNYRGGHMELVGSNSPVNLASSPIRIVIVEEPDRCAANAGGEGNSIKLATERTKTFFNRKFIIGGSPTIKGESQIEAEMELSDQRYFELPCPKCDKYQVLEWANVIWDKTPGRNHKVYGDHVPETARYRCDCGAEWSNAEKNQQLSKGKWRATAEFTGTAGFFISELYSPFPKATLADVACKFLEAKKKMDAGNNFDMITFINTSLGETWEEKGEGVQKQNLIDRVETYRKDSIDPGILVITAAVDCQADRLECEIVGWGEGEESWSLDYLILEGDPNQDEVWQELDKVFERKWKRNGVELQIVCTCIDSSDGNSTESVYRYVYPRQVRRIYAIKGKSTEGDPIVGKPSKKSLMKGLKLFPIGTDTAKSLIYSRLKLTEPGPGFCHFPDHYPDEYFKQLTSEELVTRYVKGKTKRYWKKKRPRNEALDLRVYNTAALIILNPNFEKIKRGLMAAERRASKVAEPKEENRTIIRRKPIRGRKKGFVNNY